MPFCKVLAGLFKIQLSQLGLGLLQLSIKFSPGTHRAKPFLPPIHTPRERGSTEYSVALDESSVCHEGGGGESEGKGQCSHRVPCQGAETREELSLQSSWSFSTGRAAARRALSRAVEYSPSPPEPRDTRATAGAAFTLRRWVTEAEKGIA